MRKTRARTDIDGSDFGLTDDIVAWLASEAPRIDPERTAALFRDRALAHGWMYADWNAAFRNYVRNGERYGGVAFRPGLQDPAFDHLIDRAKAVGFRMPTRLDSVGSYRTELDTFDRAQANKAGARFANVLKKVEK